jgi:ATP/maltotriose-dependent transcriptional regulator MalT
VSATADRPASQPAESNQDLRERGIDAFRLDRWHESFRLLTAADEIRPLSAEQLELLATSAFLIGREAESAKARERAHLEWLAAREYARSARCAFWLAIELLQRGQMAAANGWLARGRRLLDARDLDCVERGYLIFPPALIALESGQAADAIKTFVEAAEIGERFDDPDLAVLARLGQGQALLHLGRPTEGIALLDEVMVSVTAGEITSQLVGLIFCAVIISCNEAQDVRRAREWTEAFGEWCAARPDLVPYRGQCLIHRAEILTLRGHWQEATEEMRRACERLSEPAGQPAIGDALYQRAELHRLQGRFAAAEADYLAASKWGRSVQPGFALLRLASGETAAAATGIRQAVEQAQDQVARTRLLPALVEILLAAGDVETARTAAGELQDVASTPETALAKAEALTASGIVSLAEGNALGAVRELRAAWSEWQALEAPYQGARTRLALSHAYQALGDGDAAKLELEAARWAFQQLGAAPELAKIEAAVRGGAARPLGLSARELEVLRLVAAGKSNREIARDLFLSEKTIARHLSNIFGKLGVTSRAAATAFAFEHDLIPRGA